MPTNSEGRVKEMRDLITAKKNMEGALRAFDSKQKELTARFPMSADKFMAIWKKGPELQGIPAFTRKNGVICVSDESMFDYSVLGESIASFCIGLDQLLVAFDLEDLNHRVFETFAWYSSAFQFMDSIMSICGIHYIHRPLAPPLVREVRKRVLGQHKPKELIELAERYFEIPFLRGESDGASWSFRRTGPSHESRWMDFEKLVVALIDSGISHEIPDPVRNMYGYLKAIAEFRTHRLEWEYFSTQFPNEGRFKAAVLAHGSDIAAIRHRAVYQNQSYDVFSYAMLEQGRRVEEFTNATEEFVRRFALAMAKWNGVMLWDIWSHLKNMKPFPQRGLDWAQLVCTYVPLWIALMEVRLEKVCTRSEILSIDISIRNLATEILASLRMDRRF